MYNIWWGMAGNFNFKDTTEQSLQRFQRGDRLYTSESDVCRRQILTYKDSPRTERTKIIIIAVDP